ncbi:demethylase [Capnocytophaga canis]|uniref:demethylase n=1 Tax=Capnocytophaga canis TaxID=1848903 RepID=UPI001561F355|nr:demethylase [Capnocytophaga canis]
MAEIVKNNKGFKIIKLSLEEIEEIFKGFGICDCCSDFDKVNEELFLIPVLNNRSYCQKCYNEWIEKAENYEEDRGFEQKLFEYDLGLIESYECN